MVCHKTSSPKERPLEKAPKKAQQELFFETGSAVRKKNKKSFYIVVSGPPYVNSPLPRPVQPGSCMVRARIYEGNSMFPQASGNKKRAL